MSKFKITGQQMQCIFIMFWLGSLVVLGVNQDAKQDSWIPILLSGLMFLPFIWVYVRLIHLYPNMNLFDILFKIFGKIFGRIITIFYILFALHIGSLLIRVFAEFIQILSMPETPQLVFTSFIALVCAYCVRNGPENIGRISKLTWPILALFIVLPFLIALKDMDFNNLLPVMDSDFKTLIKGGYNITMLPLGQGILCLSLFSSIAPNQKVTKILIKSLIYTLVAVLLVNLRNILVLGFPSVTMFYFPSYKAVSVISVGDFFTRTEVIIGINLMLAGVVKICVSLYTAALGLARVFNFQDYKPMIVPCTLIMITMTPLVYESTEDMAVWLKIFPMYAIPTEIILPVVILIGAEIQTRWKSGGAGASNSNQIGNQSSNKANKNNNSSSDKSNKAGNNSSNQTKEAGSSPT